MLLVGQHSVAWVLAVGQEQQSILSLSDFAKGLVGGFTHSLTLVRLATAAVCAHRSPVLCPRAKDTRLRNETLLMDVQFCQGCSVT
ncbi:uncharacterized protein ColSpa_00142 [Colletotrichum spaethianum]|uniref:Uncharacterized protein n=1 Tax=Colletotrichum spaethianum TaxID=700344 RepID=A0AA37L1G9_9PEZI|nr:uncharacterized protein ColSpa_00142 [Colletotrichum spaethianum]GKT39961.1 hypothetical protein ColSpa_00142 [Colletotrichum spaethianum]